MDNSSKTRSTGGVAGPLTRRAVLAGGLGVTATVGLRGLFSGVPTPVRSPLLRLTNTSANPRIYRHLVATDGWASMPYLKGVNDDVPFFPDTMAPGGEPLNLNTYVFGFRDVTKLMTKDPTSNKMVPAAWDRISPYKMQAQISAPVLGFDEETDIYVTLSNLGLQIRPDLVDGHTLHWHGFQNAIPAYDGVPELSFSIPISRSFTYFYRPHDAGTYMYHCHFEDVEHVQMGMSGIIYVRPKQNDGTHGYPAGKYAYNDGDGSTRYDREYSMFLTEIWSAAHYRDAHIQSSDWTDFAASFYLINGRSYPDTVAASVARSIDPDDAPAGDRLKFQPRTARLAAKPGETVLLRIASLGFQNHAITVDGLTMQVVAKDSSRLVASDGSPNYIDCGTVDVGPGESRDVLLRIPSSTPDGTTFVLYDRNLSHLSNGKAPGLGGMRTELVVHTSLPPQSTIDEL